MKFKEDELRAGYIAAEQFMQKNKEGNPKISMDEFLDIFKDFENNDLNNKRLVNCILGYDFCKIGVIDSPKAIA